MAHEHSVFDTDPQFVVDAVTMKIACDSEVKSLRRGDVAAEEYSFRMPRHIDGHDMSLCNKVEVHYNNLHYDKDTRETTMNSSFDEVGNFGVAEDSDEYVVWTWRVGGDATQLSGSLNFCIRLACMNGAEIEYQKFTEIYESIPVGETIYNTDAVAYDSKDVLEAWRQELLEAIEHGGAVKTVNGASPDENGNVELEIPEGFSGSWNALVDKPFGETTAMGDTLYWDGNTEGLVSVRELSIYKVSDVTPSYSDFANGCTVRFHDDDATFIIGQEDLYLVGDAISMDGGVYIIPESAVGTDLNGEGTLIFPESGIYFAFMPGVIHTASLTIPGYNGFETTTIKPIETKYLPEALQFGTEVKEGLVITPEMAKNATEFMEVDGGQYAKVSDRVDFTPEDFIGAEIHHVDGGIDRGTIVLDESNISSTVFEIPGVCLMVSSCFIVPKDAEYEGMSFKKGFWVLTVGDGEQEFTIKIPDKNVVTPMDEKYMPTLTSPNGTKYKLSVADDGTLSAVQA